jgi:flagellar hook assembly protein FlgD
MKSKINKSQIQRFIFVAIIFGLIFAQSYSAEAVRSIGESNTFSIDTLPVSLSSSTHPSSTKWYANTTVKFTWQPIVEGIIGYYVILSENNSVTPTPENAQDYIIGAEKNYQNLSDGTWVFNIRGEFQDGTLTDSYSYRVNIDSTPEVSSSSHPDQQKWYQSRDVKMNWNIKDIPSARTFYYILDDKSDTSPDKSKATKTNDTSLKTALPSDGEWYFHLVWEDEVGSLSKTAHYKFAVDATPPEPVTQLSVLLTDEGYINLSWVEPKDNASGVANYQIFRSIFKGAVGARVGTDITEMEFVDKTVEKGQVYYYTVMPVDKAGNKQVNGNVQISTENAPTEGVLNVQPSEGHVGDEIEVSGMGFEANEQVKVKLGDVEVSVKAGENGSFKATLKVPTLAKGKQVLVAETKSRKIEGWFEMKGRVSEVTPSKAPVGSVITVVGDGFAANAKVSVMIGGEATSIVRDKETTSDGRLSVDVVVPKMGIGIQTLTVSDGQSEVASSIQVIEGEPIGVYQTELSLTKGINIISLSLKPETPWTAKTIVKELGTTIVIRALDGNFKTYVEGDIGEDFPIEANKGYIVNVTKPVSYTLLGTTWGESIAAAPPIEVENPTWAFVVTGVILRKQSFRTPSNIAMITNLRTAETTTAKIDENGRFIAAFLDLNRHSVIQVDDAIELSFIDQHGNLLSKVIKRIEPEQVERAYINTLIELRPAKTALFQNYPNPFNPETWIPFALAENAKVGIQIYDLTGRLVRNLHLGGLEAGSYMNKGKAVYWDGRNEQGEKVASGVYIYQMVADKKTFTRRMVILK